VPPDYSRELSLGADRGQRIAGIDEAGRGPLAGPVVAAAVVLHRDRLPNAIAAGLDDSKAVARPRREALADALPDHAEVAVGIASVAEIDTLNILHATMLAMRRACDGLSTPPDAALIDGNRAPVLPCAATAVVRGDGLSLSIAAASLVAKTHRDRIMAGLARAHPGYGWERNMGYGTREHRAALHRLGITPHHRKTFRPVIEAIQEPTLPIT
jgi:ribonuclease HII